MTIPYVLRRRVNSTALSGQVPKRLSIDSSFPKAWLPCWVALGNAIAFSRLSRYIPAVSLAEIKTAVEALSPDELTELATFIRDRDNAAWDRPIDSDFSDAGRLYSVAEEVRADIRAGRLQDLP